MSRDDIIRMAMEAEGTEFGQPFSETFVAFAERFANLVAAQEREACVDLLLRLHERSGGAHNYYQFAAEQIRTRGETK
jgi:hypothetical protein